jgi:hypothetical protein
VTGPVTFGSLLMAMPSFMRLRLLVFLLAAIASVGSAGPSYATTADDAPPDICLKLWAHLDERQSAALGDAVRRALAARPVLIPEPMIGSVSTSEPSVGGPWLRLGIWTAGGTGSVEVPSPGDATAWCGADPAPGAWSAVISFEFLRAGTKRELAATPTTPGFSSSIDVELDGPADLVRTVLTFSGPLDIPNGTCWMDDVVSADGSGGTRADTTTGSKTSPFGDGVCGRFEEYLADGGAGAQAIVLLPREVLLPDDGILRLRVDAVDVRADGIHLAGTVERSDS